MAYKRQLPEVSSEMHPITRPAAPVLTQVAAGMRRGRWLVILSALIACAQTRPEAHTADSMAAEILAAHNVVRVRLGITPLSWSQQLADLSQKWADTLLARHKFEHNPKSPYGENLFEITGAAARPAYVVKTWASEATNYDYRSNVCDGVCGHYTQVVWRSTSKVGCAVARGDRREVWVCSYDPPGNYLGKRPY